MSAPEIAQVLTALACTGISVEEWVQKRREEERREKEDALSIHLALSSLPPPAEVREVPKTGYEVRV